ncbi:efflux RND transporter permease subunit [Leptospira langatensis]|uniref:Efflux RND transporter permease subunit n=1 Tax=Leptospira langatensis TaxID=2484983 RepID=A0A5F1ZQP0_9LEPT|nr:efflux RND transporter permease subunit [Leptospira langatensis]TGK05457.1 efflux RND transporter permease subunit [Leptospira langatensis]TGL38593.1 efflux RND transporter permease subunit [Leptospira langatensis]
MSDLKDFLRERILSVCMLFFGLLLFGVLAFFQVPVTLFPSIAYPGLTISVDYPGADVLLVEELLTAPLEEAVSGVGGIEEIRSFAERGKTEINIEFRKGVNIDLKGLEIRERIDLIASGFPREVHKPLILQYDPDQRPVMILSLESQKFDFATLRSIADNELRRYLETVEGVSKITPSGGKVREVLIGCDLQKLRAYGLGLGDIQEVIQKNNKDASIGAVEKSGGTAQLRIFGKYSSLRDLQRQPLHSAELGRVFFLEDVAQVSFAYRDEESAARINGKETVSVFVYKSSLGNTLQIASSIRQKLEDLKIPDVRFNVVYDQSDSIRKTYLNILICFSLGAALLGGFWYYRRSRGRDENYITLFSQFPLNFFLVQFVLFISKTDFDIIIACSILLGFAMWLVVYQSLPKEKKAGPGVFSFRNTIGDFISLVVILLSLCLPLYYLDPDTGQSTLRLGVFIVLYLSFSYFLFPPFHLILSRLRGLLFGSYVSVPDRVEGEDGEEDLFPKGGSAYRFRLGSGNLSEKIFWGLYLFFILFGLFNLVRSDKELFYSIENKRIIGIVELPSGFNFSQTNEITKKIEEKIAAAEGFVEVTSKVDPGHAFLVITVDDSKVDGDDFIQKVRASIGDISPAFCYFSRESENSRFKEVRIDILGDDLDKLDDLAKNLGAKASKMKGVGDVVLNYKSPRDELELSLNNHKTSGASLNNSEVAGFLRTAIQGSVISKFISDNREMDIRLRALKEFRDSKESLEKFVVKNQVGKYVPIPEVTSQKEAHTPTRVFRKNKKRVLSFSLRLTSGSYNSVKSEIVAELEKDLPENYYIELGRSMEKILETENRLYGVIAFSLVLIYMVLASYFESFREPLAVIGTAVLPFFATLSVMSLVFGTLSLPVYLGLLLTISIACFHVMRILKTGEAIGTGFRRRSAVIGILALFLPQILFSREGGRFLMEFEVTLFVGYGSSLLLTAWALPHIQKFLSSIDIKSLVPARKGR